MICNILKRATTALVCLVVLTGVSAGPSQATEVNGAALAAMIEDAHAVADALENQIGVMEEFAHNNSGYLLRDTNGALYYFPFHEAEELASLLSLQVWMGHADGFRGVGGDLGDLPAAIHRAVLGEAGNLKTEGAADLEKINVFIEAFVASALAGYDETNRDDLNRQIHGLQEELRGVNALIEDAEFELAARDNQDAGGQSQAAESSADDTDEKADWRTVMAQRDAVLPQGVTLIDPVPSMDRVCNEPAETPIWILVADASVCTGQWAAKGSGDYQGQSGKWCVWCPDDMYWRSGWGCCFPN